MFSPLKSTARRFHQSACSSAEKYFKITRYAKPVDKTVYRAGDVVSGMRIPQTARKYPVYEYEAKFFKRQNRGLYGGLQRGSSKSCSESGNKNLRAHLPNVVRAKVWSETLNKLVSTRASTKVLRTIDKEGGLDKYLLKDKPARIKTMGLKGWRLRYDIMKKQQLQEQSQGLDATVYHVDKKGRQITVGRNKLLKLLYPYVKRDSYEFVKYRDFLANHTWWTTEELIEKLDEHGYDFGEICVNSK